MNLRQHTINFLVENKDADCFLITAGQKHLYFGVGEARSKAMARYLIKVNNVIDVNDKKVGRGDSYKYVRVNTENLLNDLKARQSEVYNGMVKEVVKSAAIADINPRVLLAQLVKVGMLPSPPQQEGSAPQLLITEE